MIVFRTSSLWAAIFFMLSLLVPYADMRSHRLIAQITSAIIFSGRKSTEIKNTAHSLLSFRFISVLFSFALFVCDHT